MFSKSYGYPTDCAAAQADRLPERTAASIHAALERLSHEQQETQSLLGDLEEKIRFVLVPQGDAPSTGDTKSAGRPLTSVLVNELDAATERSLDMNARLRAMLKAIHL